MREKDLPFDRTKHVCYTKNARKCVQKLLRRYYDEQKAAGLWEKIQLQYCEYLKDEPAMAGAKITVSIYDPILIFAWYAVVPDKPPIEEIQQDVYACFMGSFDTLGKVFDLNRRFDNRLANRIFKKTSDIRKENAEFAKRHHMEDVLPVMCNCDHLAMQKLHATLIREGTCCTASCCDYCIVGNQNPLAKAYELVKSENCLLVNVRKQTK